VALFGPTDPEKHVAPGGDCKVIKKTKKCGPCYKPVCDKGYVCMKSITPSEVIRAANDLLNVRTRQ
ncbi:MAG: lipopolysaccharide heptosyltransferase II, partial [Candidatus Omnitrophota bacterium]